MNNSKLVNVLRTFSKNELKEFEKFVSSPAYNKGRNYMPFLNMLKKFYPRFEDEKMTPEYIHSKLYPGKEFNRQVIWNMNSGLFDIAEEFLIFSNLKHNKYSRDQMLAEAYYERMLMPLFIKTVDEMEKIISKQGMEDNYFHSKTELVVYRKAYIFMEDKQHLIPGYVIEKGEYSILHFLKSITGVIIDMESNAKMFNAKFEIDLPHYFIRNFNFESFIEYARSKNYRYTWIIEMCYHSIMCIIKPESLLHYTSLKGLIEQYFNEFKIIEKNNWLTVLINYCVNRAGDGDDYFRRELLEINKFQLREKIFPLQRHLPKILFLQILRNALSVGETQWAGQFIADYVSKLKPSHQKPMHALGNAYLCFKLGKFNDVIENLKAVKFIDSRDKLQSRNLYIKTYFELGETENVLYQIDSTRHFISKSNAFTEKTKSSYHHSLSMIYKLVMAKVRNDEREIEKISQSTLIERDPVFGKWLFEKINELNQK